MDVVAPNHALKNFKHFWKTSKRLNVSVGGVIDHRNIANTLKDGFTVRSLLEPTLNVRC